MKENKKVCALDSSNKKFFCWAGLLLLIFFSQAFWHAKDKSATYDEMGHLTVSALLLKTEHSEYDISHPPLLRWLFAIPLRLLNPSLPDLPLPKQHSSGSITDNPISILYNYGFHFLHENQIQMETLYFCTRMINILLASLLGCFIYLWAKKLYGNQAALFALTLFVFCPNLIAHSSLITTDLGGVTFAIGFLYSLSLLTERKTWADILFCGILLGLAQISKFSNLFLLPIFFLFFIGCKKIEGEKNKEIILTLFAVLAIAWFVVCAGYKFEGVFAAHTLPAKDWELLGWGSPLQSLYRWIPLPDSFLKGFLSVVWHNQRGHGAYLLGEYSSTGWWYYFPIAFLLKTPSAVLLLFLFWIVSFLRHLPLSLTLRRSNGQSHRRRPGEAPGEKKWAFSRDEILLCLCLLFFFSTAMTSKINIGIRHILICFPLLYILLGKIATKISWKQVKTKVAVAALSFLLIAEVASVSPHYLAFFNRVCGGPEKGINYLSDSNIDWGQELKNLASYLKREGNPELLLSYFGTAVPQYYGIQYQALPTAGFLPPSDHLNSQKPLKEFLAVSLTNLQATYFRKRDLYGWLANKKPVAKIGYSIYVYDITSDLESQQEILEIYRLTGEVNKFLRQVARVNHLQKAN